MIDLTDVTFSYARAPRPTLKDVTLHIEEGELVLLAGRTGSGKSTLLGTLNGLVPRFTGGRLDGDVVVDGRSTRDHAPREMAETVGYVGQDPLAGFVTDTVEEELAYGMEQLGVDPRTMRRRVEETLDLLGIADLRRRALRNLSGGQQQRVAIGSVIAVHPRVVVLDEPTSALDPTAAEEVLATLARLVQDLGTTVVLAEHRMERVIPFADRMVLVEGDGSVTDGRPEEVLARSAIAPPIIELGRELGWQPLPLTVRSARVRAAGLRRALAGTGPVRPERRLGRTMLSARDIVVRYGSTVAVRGVDLTLRAGEVVCVMGRNGSGKSSLFWAVQGSGPRAGGSVDVGGQDPGRRSAKEARRLVGLVPQTASDLLYLETVGAECAAGDAEADAVPGTCAALLERLAPGIPADRHPRNLSEGQKLALVLAVQLTASPDVLMLDEPTRGLDYTAKAAFAHMVAGLAAEGKAVAMATHDVELMARIADRVIVMAEGEVVSDGPAREVLGESPAFAPQVAKIVGPQWLTVADVRTAPPDVLAAARAVASGARGGEGAAR